jgi:hypothetical protein
MVWWKGWMLNRLTPLNGRLVAFKRQILGAGASRLFQPNKTSLKDGSLVDWGGDLNLPSTSSLIGNHQPQGKHPSRKRALVTLRLSFLLWLVTDIDSCVASLYSNIRWRRQDAGETADTLVDQAMVLVTSSRPRCGNAFFEDRPAAWTLRLDIYRFWLHRRGTAWWM